MADKLNMDYINSLPQPFMAKTICGGEWPVHTICVQTALVWIDVVGKFGVISISDVDTFIDMEGGVHDPDSFWLED